MGCPRDYQPNALPAAPPSQRRCWANRASPRPLLTQQGAGTGRSRAGAQGHRRRGCSTSDGRRAITGICVYKARSGSPGGLFSTTTPRLTRQHGEALPECRQPNPEVRESGSDLSMGPRLLLTLMLLQAGEYHPSVPLPCQASPCPGTASPLAIGFACFTAGPPCDLAK